MRSPACDSRSAGRSSFESAISGRSSRARSPPPIRCPSAPEPGAFTHDEVCFPADNAQRPGIDQSRAETPMKTFRVGGSVRDEILGKPVVDRDYVVVGATPEQMIADGFRPVGRDFP